MITREPPQSRFLFPDPRHGVGRHGIICVGGDFAPGTLLAAYRKGIFPWPVSSELVPWCSPDPRAILPLTQPIVWSRSVQRAIRKKPFSITVDKAFEQVMVNCAKRDEGTWITGELSAGFCELHSLGWAHSIEVWNQDSGALVGGIYGLAIGGMFAGESMFHRETDASKVAFAALIERLHKADFQLFDAQLMTDHLASLGCTPVGRSEYLKQLAGAIRQPCVFPKGLCLKIDDASPFGKEGIKISIDYESPGRRRILQKGILCCVDG